MTQVTSRGLAVAAKVREGYELIARGLLEHMDKLDWEPRSHISGSFVLKLYGVQFALDVKSQTLQILEPETETRVEIKDCSDVATMCAVLTRKADAKVVTMTEATNENRADWADHAMRAFAHTTGMDHAGEDQETVLQDLLADLMHLCDRDGMDFERAASSARSCCQEELEEERCQSRT